jgi:hypothetical protein
VLDQGLTRAFKSSRAEWSPVMVGKGKIDRKVSMMRTELAKSSIEESCRLDRSRRWSVHEAVSSKCIIIVITLALLYHSIQKSMYMCYKLKDPSKWCWTKKSTNSKSHHFVKFLCYPCDFTDLLNETL